MAGYLYVGSRLYRMLRKLSSDSSKRKRKMHEVGFVTGVCTICFILRAAMILVTAFVQMTDIDCIFMFCYYLFAELVPCVLVLFILRKLPPRQARRPPLCMEEDHTPEESQRLIGERSSGAINGSQGGLYGSYTSSVASNSYTTTFNPTTTGSALSSNIVFGSLGAANPSLAASLGGGESAKRFGSASTSIGERRFGSIVPGSLPGAGFTGSLVSDGLPGPILPPMSAPRSINSPRTSLGSSLR
eukprot:Colp12_sorted_trinity150504_noHs@10712